MKEMFLVGTGQPEDRMVYYSDLRTMSGEMIMSNVEDAHLFQSMEEVAEFLVKNSGDMRWIIVSVLECTWERIIDGSKNPEFKELYNKFNTVSYVTNSR